MLLFYEKGQSPRAIMALLVAEQISASVTGVAKFLKRYQQTGTTARQTGSGGKQTVTEAVKDIVEKQMREDDESTATQLRAAVARAGHNLSTRTSPLPY